MESNTTEGLLQKERIKSRNKCNPKAKKISELEIQDLGVVVYRDYMQEHVVI